MKAVIFGQKLGDPECPYMRRWVLNFGPLGSIRLHHWYRSDDKRFKHDHPSDFITLVLKGTYTDLCDGPGRHKIEPYRCGVCKGRPGVICDICGNGLRNEKMIPGKIRRRSAEHIHTVAVDPPGCWTLLYFWPERRDWGFWVPRKLDGVLKWTKSNKFFLEHGNHPCDQS